MPANPASRGYKLLQNAVGALCPNQRDDVESVQRLLNITAASGRMSLSEGMLKCDGAFGKKTLAGIMTFQHAVLGIADTDTNVGTNGRIEPSSSGLVALCESLPDLLNSDLLALCYLRAGDDDLQDFAARIAHIMAAHDINTPLRQAHFLAQIGHESGELRFREEIASGSAYEGRKDLGNTQPGDGVRFKGRGLIQLTGRANYAAYGRAINREQDLITHPQQVAIDTDLCVDVAAWYWSKNNLNSLADNDDLLTLTRRINGGLNGLDDRRRLLSRAMAVLPRAA